MDLQKLWDNIFSNSWQIKLVASVFMTLVTFLIGEINLPLVALVVLIILDTVTAYWYLAKKTLQDQEEQGSIMYGFLLALHCKVITSAIAREKIGTKLGGYLILLIGFNMLAKVIPATFFGMDIEKTPTVFITSWLAFIELQSMIENMIDTGMTFLQPLAVFVCRKREGMTGEAVTQPINQNQGGK